MDWEAGIGMKSIELIRIRKYWRTGEMKTRTIIGMLPEVIKMSPVVRACATAAPSVMRNG